MGSWPVALRAALAGLIVGVGAVPLGPAAPAAAHAAVVATTPQQQSVIGRSPTLVTVTFTEPVTVVPGRAQVIAPDGKRITTGEASTDGATLRIPVRVADRPLGTYLVSYRVISADSHPVAGGFTFSVGAPSASAPAPPDDGAHRSVAVAVPAAKYLGYAGLVLLVGPALLLALLWPRSVPRRAAVQLVHAGVGLVAVATVAGLWLQAPYSSGAAALDVSPGELRPVLTSDFGLTLLARLGLLAAVAALLPPVLRGHASRGRAAALLAVGVAGLATWPLSGHAAASASPPVSVLADVVHLAAMAVWLGGLVTLVAVLLRRAHPRVLGVLLPVWSRWAAIALVWLVGGGVVQSMVEIGAVRPLLTSDYGRLVLAKVGLLALALLAAAYARRVVRRRTATAGDRGRLRRVVGLEVGAVAVVLGLSATLVQTTPGRSADAVAAAAVSDSFAQTLTSPLYTLQFDIYPVQLGPSNTVHAYLYTAQGRPLRAVEWRLTAALPSADVAPVSTPLLGLQDHHAVGAVAFPVPGEWQLRFTIRTSEIDQASVTTTVTVR